MTSEAIMIKQLEPSDRLFQVTVLDNAGIAKGTLMQISSDPNTATKTSADGDLFIGILAEEKVADDGQTEMAVWQRGVFALQTAALSGAIAVGERVKISGANEVALADDDTIANAQEIVGIALESTTDQTTELIQVLVGAHG